MDYQERLKERIAKAFDDCIKTQNDLGNLLTEGEFSGASVEYLLSQYQQFTRIKTLLVLYREDFGNDSVKAEQIVDNKLKMMDDTMIAMIKKSTGCR